MLAALALAALLGVLLPSDDVVHAQQAQNTRPQFDDNLNDSPEVDENTPPGTNIGDPYTATDPDEASLEFGDTLTYSLEGEDAASFNLDPLTGQLSTKAPLDYEETSSYSVTVKVEDSGGGTDTIMNDTSQVGIRVRDVVEPPAAPIAPTVTSGPDNDSTTIQDESTTSLKVVWHGPENVGDGVDRYDVQYKKSTDTSFTDHTHNTTATTATIGELVADTSYQVRVRATNGNTEGPWSFSGTGSTNKENNSPPTFIDTLPVSRNILENTSAGQNVGARVAATDRNASTLTYRLEGPHAGLFDFVASTGQIRTKAALNHEDARCGYDNTVNQTQCHFYVTVAVFDGAGGSDALGVTIDVTDVSERPEASTRPTVRATEKSSTSLDVSWNAPKNAGPPITGYEVEYREDSSGNFLSEGVTLTGSTTATISPTDESLTPGASYEVRVRAANTGEGVGYWSASGTGRTSAANREPIFAIRPNNEERKADRTVNRTVAENTRPGQLVERAVGATDGDADKLTYKLVDAVGHTGDAAKFDIDESNGRILTEAPLNHENPDCGYDENDDQTTCTYTVTVEVSDGLNEDRNKEETANADDTITVMITVRDLDEPPVAPAVTVTSPTDGTTLVVTWNVPDNTGPEITSYRVECSGPGVTDQCPHTTSDGTNTTHTITDLTAGSSYQVRVRMDNDEGTGAWSGLVRQSTNRASNAAPTFDQQISSPLEVAENTSSGQNVGTAVSATDTDSNDRLAYSLEGPDRNSFTIGGQTGQIKTRSSLNHEDAPCGYNTGVQTQCIYTVRVKISDGNGGSAAQNVTIMVTNVEEPPEKPAAPRVTAAADTGKSLEVTWNEPRNTGPAITDYDIQYRKYRQGTNNDEFVGWGHEGAERKATITGLDPRTQYEVEVWAKSEEGDSAENWSAPGRGTTGVSNKRPTFDDTSALVTRSVLENTRSGQNVGSAVSASDDDANRLTYRLDGPAAASFDINSSSGQIRTRSGVTYNYEEKSSYSVTVKVDDGQGKGNSVAAKSVTIQIDDLNESPSVPAAPRVSGVPGSTDSVRVVWDEPVNTGPPITQYDVQYRESGAAGFTSGSHDGVDTSTIITGLKAGTRYEVQVRARSDEGVSAWSRSGTGSPNPDAANRNPEFSGGAQTFSVAENTEPNTDVGTSVAATDRDADTLTYTLEGTDADSFGILWTGIGGQILTSAALNYEEKSSYTVTVRVTDGRGGADAVNVTIRVTDVDGEAPDVPIAPTVTSVSSMSLQVNWGAPENPGPPITDYDYRYRGPTGSWTEVTGTTITGTMVTISGLTASTSYDVEVRAKNAEGTSDWSNSGIGSTGVPGVNNPPVFREGTSDTRTVYENAAAGTPIDEPVTAADADSGDTLTYSLEGTYAASFNINSSNGQLLTRTGVALAAGTTYEVTVAASDGIDSARITVTITATASPPNNPPVFREGTTAARSVARSAPAGTAVGDPVTATDADSGDTLTYSFEGTDAASFSINSSTGQLLTRTGVTLDAATYTVTVSVTDQGTASATITVTITVVPNVAPVFTNTSTNRSVAENVPAGTDVGAPVTATDADNDSLTYTLGGADAALFAIDSRTGQITVGSGTTVDYETRTSYTVVVTATDQSGERDEIIVTISVTDAGLGPYDLDNNERISRSEVIAAVRDYFARRITKAEVIGLIQLYFSSG